MTTLPTSLENDGPAALAAMLYLQQRMDALLENVSLGIVIIDLVHGSLLNRPAAEWLGLPRGTRDTATLVAAMQETRSRCLVESALEDDPGTSPDGPQPVATEYWISAERGLVLRVESRTIGQPGTPGRFWVFTNVKPLWDSTQKLKAANTVLQRNIVMLAEEMDSRMEAEAELRRYNQGLKQENDALAIGKQQSDQLANQDTLTGLANARKFRHDLDEMLHEARQRDEQVAVVFIDLDRFKEVNDTLGHERGDYLLCRVAEALVQTLRKGDLPARMGGDEFTCAIKMNRGQGPGEIAATVRRLSKALNMAVEGAHQTIHVSATIGLAVFPVDATDSVTLLRAADNAMYVGKRRGGNEVVFFDQGSDVGEPAQSE